MLCARIFTWIDCCLFSHLPLLILKTKSRRRKSQNTLQLACIRKHVNMCNYVRSKANIGIVTVVIQWLEGDHSILQLALFSMIAHWCCVCVYTYKTQKLCCFPLWLAIIATFFSSKTTHIIWIRSAYLGNKHVQELHIEDKGVIEIFLIIRLIFFFTSHNRAVVATPVDRWTLTVKL